MSGIKYPLKALGRILRYWDDSPILKGKRNKEWSKNFVLSGPKNSS
jgi:hypothetical protein